MLLVSIGVFFGAPYVPTRRTDLRRMFDEFVPIGEGDLVLDIGSGDGLVLREASRRGARAVGYEVNPLFVAISQLLALHDSRQRVVLVNAWHSTFPLEVTLVYAFAVSRDGKRLEALMQREANRLQRPLRLVCFGSPLKKRKPSKTFEAYFLYEFQPLQAS